MTQSKPLSYQKALAELEKTLEELQGGKIDIDHLSEKLKQAYNLIQICRKKIQSAEMEIKKINKEFKKE